MRTSKVRFRWNLLNLLAFPFAVDARHPPGQRALRKAQGEPGLAASSCGSRRSIVWGVKLGLLALDWRKALCFVVVPQLIANLGIVGINFLWHDGCDPDHPVNHSRNFTGRLLNYLALNNGYHGMHHEEPALHWSLLPEAHARRIRPGLHPALEQPSILVYAWRTFVYPGRRETFEGKPVTFPDVDDDLDWVVPEREQRPGGLSPRRDQRVSGSVGGACSPTREGQQPLCRQPPTPRHAPRPPRRPVCVLLANGGPASKGLPPRDGPARPASVRAQHFPVSDWSFVLPGAHRARAMADTFTALVAEQADGRTVVKRTTLEEAALPAGRGHHRRRLQLAQLQGRAGAHRSGEGHPQVADGARASTSRAGCASSTSGRFRPGDPVLVTGYGLGVSVWGGFSQRARVKESVVLPIPEGLDARTRDGHRHRRLHCRAVRARAAGPRHPQDRPRAGGDRRRRWRGLHRRGAPRRAGEEGRRLDGPDVRGGLPQEARRRGPHRARRARPEGAAARLRALGRGRGHRRRADAGHPLQPDRVPRRGGGVRARRRLRLPGHRVPLHPPQRGPARLRLGHDADRRSGRAPGSCWWTTWRSCTSTRSPRRSRCPSWSTSPRASSTGRCAGGWS